MAHFLFACRPDDAKNTLQPLCIPNRLCNERGALKMQDMKMKDQVARHENARQEHVGHENATHKQ